jgi:hypothetical protein
MKQKHLGYFLAALSLVNLVLLGIQIVIETETHPFWIGLSIATFLMVFAIGIGLGTPRVNRSYDVAL